MSILKAELKQMVTHEIGVRVEDALEAAKKELSLLEGRQTAFLDGAKSVEGLLKVIDEDLNAEKYPLETGEVAKRYVLRAVQALSNLSQNATNLRMAQAGKVAGFDHTVKLLANLIEIEKKKIAQLQQAGPSLSSVPPEPEGEETGTEGPRHLSIKERRLAEEAVVQKAAADESAASAAPPAEEPAAEAEAEASEEPVEEEPTRKQRRKGKRRASNA